MKQTIFTTIITTAIVIMAFVAVFWTGYVINAQLSAIGVVQTTVASHDKVLQSIVAWINKQPIPTK